MNFCRQLLKQSIWCWLPVLSAFSCFASGNTVQKIEIVVAKPIFVLPQFTGPYSDREASITPDEYEKAERLRTMLDSGQSAAALKELEASYDIELSPAMLTLKAQIYFSLKMYDKAEASYLAVLKRTPQLVRAHSDLAQLYLVREDYSSARKYFANAVNFGSSEAIIHGQLAYLNLTTYGAFSAISGYQHAMTLEPENVQWQQGLLAALTQAKMYEAAQALLHELIAKRSDEANLWLNQAALSLHTEDYPQALISLEMAILLGDRDQRNLKTAAQLHLQLNSYDRAISLLDQSLQQNAFDMATVNEYLRWLNQLGMWDKSAKLLDGAARNVGKMNSDERSLYYLQRATIESHRKNITTAKNYFKQALENNPANGDALLAYAGFAAEQKDFVEAEMMYVRAEAVSGAEKRALIGRSQLYIDMQDYPSALNQLRSTYQKYPEMQELRNNIEIIENIIRTRGTSGA